jgi:uncharacterized protein (TIGR01569 family)
MTFLCIYTISKFINNYDFFPPKKYKPFQVILALTTAAASSAAAIVYLAHTGDAKANWVAICMQFDNFCQRTSGAVVGSFLAVLILMLLVIMSALAIRKH